MDKNNKRKQNNVFDIETNKKLRQFYVIFVIASTYTIANKAELSYRIYYTILFAKS